MNNCKIVAILIAAFAWSVPNAYAQKNHPENKHADSASQWKGTRVHVLKANTIVPQKPIARVGILAVDSLVIKNPICVVFSPTIIPPVKMADEGPKADKQNSTANEPFFTKWKDVIAALGMLGALGVSLGALCISIRALRYTGNLFRVTRNGTASQIRESKNLVGITKDTANKQLRAYAGVERMKIYPTKVTIRIKNFGSTPAKNVRLWCAFAAADLDVPALLALRTNSDASLLAGDTLWPASSVQRGKEFSDLGIVFFAHGLILYEDIFGVERSTTFQHMLAVTENVHLGYAHTKGNSAT